MNKPHYIAGSGSFGCLYDSCQSFSSHREAVLYLSDLFDLSEHMTANLAAYNTLHFADYGIALAGADYCEITECNCQDSNIHND